MENSPHHNEETFQVATLAGGCFWCIEAVFVLLKGVVQVKSGYTGGESARPSYQEVCSGTTGHAEAVQITFRPAEINYQQILEVFFTVHDPTTLNRQGPDFGTQYRSAIFYNDEAQKVIAERVVRELGESKIWDNPIVTEISSLREFYPAEEYHQDFFSRNPFQPYCRAIVAPKVAKFRKQYMEHLKK